MSWEEAVVWLRDNADPQKRQLAAACYFDGEALEAARRFADGDEWRAIRALLPSPPEAGRALDLGAGRGISSFALAQDGWQVDAVEPYESDLVGTGAIEEIARMSDLDINVVTATAESLPFEDERFDVVHCRQALHHADDLMQMCREAMRVLRKGGVFLATREHVLSREEDLEDFLSSHSLHFLYGGENAFTLEQYLDALNGTSPAEIEVLSPRMSDVNLFPSSKEAERRRIAKVAGVPPSEVPDFVFRVCDHFDRTPGRLYSFKVVK